jgi:hypothetical protein
MPWMWVGVEPTHPAANKQVINFALPNIHQFGGSTSIGAIWYGNGLGGGRAVFRPFRNTLAFLVDEGEEELRRGVSRLCQRQEFLGGCGKTRRS